MSEVAMENGSNAVVGDEKKMESGDGFLQRMANLAMDARRRSVYMTSAPPQIGVAPSGKPRLTDSAYKRRLLDRRAAKKNENWVRLLLGHRRHRHISSPASCPSGTTQNVDAEYFCTFVPRCGEQSRHRVQGTVGCVQCVALLGRKRQIPGKGRAVVRQQRRSRQFAPNCQGQGQTGTAEDSHPAREINSFCRKAGVDFRVTAKRRCERGVDRIQAAAHRSSRVPSSISYGIGPLRAAPKGAEFVAAEQLFPAGLRVIILSKLICSQTWARSRGGHLGSTGGTECTSQRVGKNRRCQRMCLNRRRVCRFAGSVGFYPRAARYILYPPYPPGAHLCL